MLGHFYLACCGSSLAAKDRCDATSLGCSIIRKDARISGIFDSGSTNAPRVVNRKAIQGQNSTWGKCSDLHEARFWNRGCPTAPNWDDQ
jgi:hypothetical protein